MNDFSAVDSTNTSVRSHFRPGLIPPLGLHIVVCCVSFVCVASSFADLVAFGSSHMFAGLLSVASFSIVAIFFAVAPFSYGYILGYLWLIEFSKLSSLPGICFNFSFRPGVSRACPVHHFPHQPAI